MQTFSTLLITAIVLAGTVAIQPTAQAGSLKSWDKTKSGAARWKSLANFGNAAVLDSQTGLVWETTPSGDTVTLPDATIHCANAIVGGQVGFRLPTVGELATLRDPTQSDALPIPNPFTINAPAVFWTSTLAFVHASEPTLPLYMVYIANGSGSNNEFAHQAPDASGFRAWCVRAPGGN